MVEATYMSSLDMVKADEAWSKISWKLGTLLRVLRARESMREARLYLWRAGEDGREDKGRRGCR